ncbi:hypothetical protein HK102_013667 [Quaeritorhiza haematococci]|nr:hypothetical protein HK102_013667 [Quaeritorhiza haematococci]
MSAGGLFQNMGEAVPAQPRTPPESFNFDESKILTADSEEKKELYLFQWFSALEKDLKTCQPDFIKEHQAKIEKTLLKYMNSANPKPSRPVRHLIGRIFVVLYSRGDQRTLFDTLTGTQTIASSKKFDDPAIRLASIYSMGLVTEFHGNKVMSLFPETVSICVKTLKNAKETELGLRHVVLTSLARALKGAGKAAGEPMVKEMMKIAKTGLVDKVPLIRAAAAELMLSLCRYTHQPVSLNKYEEYDSLLITILKSLDGSNEVVRRVVSGLIAHILSTSQSAPAPGKATTAKKPAKPVAAADASGASTAIGSSDQTILTVDEMLSLLASHFVKTTSREVRIGIVESYVTLFKTLGIKFVEGQYVVIVKHMLDLAAHAKLTTTRNDLLLMRHLCGFVLREVGKMISEGAQITALRELSTNWLRKWPAVTSNEVAPSKMVLVCVLNEVAALLIDLGPAAAAAQDALIEPCMTLLGHTSESVNVALAWALKCLCSSLPIHLPWLMNRVISLLQKDMANHTGEKPEHLRRFVGYSNALAALISVVPNHSLHVSFESAAKVFGLSTQLLKSASGPNAKDPRVMLAQTQAAWNLIGSLMCLGPNFVRVHLSQLLLFWKNIFPKPIPKDSNANRSESEWLYVLSSRASALSALHSFLVNCSHDVITADVAKRIVVCLNNTMTFLSTLPTSYPTSSTPPPGAPPQIQTTLNCRAVEIENVLRKNLFQCYACIQPASIYDTTYALLMKAVVDAFAPESDKTMERLVGVVMPSNDKNASVPAIDPLAVTSFMKGLRVDVAGHVGAEDRGGIERALFREGDFQAVEEMLNKQVFESLEYDPSRLFIHSPHHSGQKQAADSVGHGLKTRIARPDSMPISTAVIDAAIEMFALLFPLQSAHVQESTLEQMIKTAKPPQTSGKSTATPQQIGRRNAVHINMMVGVVGALKYVMVKKGTLASGRVPVAIRDLVEDALNHPNTVMRGVACEILGRLARAVGTAAFVGTWVQNLVDQVVKNRDPDSRAGAALALGCIHSYVGGMAAGSHLKTIVGILHSLSSDPHPVVHTWALHSLWLTVESAGLMYGPYVNSTLAVIAKLFMTESHEPTAPLANSSSIDGGNTSSSLVYPALGRILQALLGVVGPELQASSKIRELCFSLYEELKNDSDPSVVVEAIRCIQNFILFAPKHVDIGTLVPFLQVQLSDDFSNGMYLMRRTSVTCLYQLAQRNPGAVLAAAAAVNNQLEEQLFALLDVETDVMVQDEMKDILLALLKHVAPTNPSRWLDLCKNILSKGGAAWGPSTGAAGGAAGAAVVPVEAATTKAADEDDEETFDVDHGDGRDSTDSGSVRVGPVPGAGAAAGTAQRGTAATGAYVGPQVAGSSALVVILLPRWRTQVFALALLRQVLNVVKTSDIKEHFDLACARVKKAALLGQGEKPDFLVLRLADLIRVAFNAATANVHDLNLEGLYLLEDILEKYAETPDPDVDDHPLLEQYQAQISAALTPAFANDAMAEVTSLACRVSATYIGSGINKDIATLGRLLKSLSSSLDKIKDNTGRDASSPHIDVMLKLAVLTAWAELQNASFKQSYLREVVQPNLKVLTRLWLLSLRDYAKVKFDSDMLPTLTASGGADGPGSSMDMYLAATRDVILPFHQRSWVPMMQALASLIDQYDQLLLPALQQESELSSKEPGITKSVASLSGTGTSGSPKMLHILLGLCIEACSNPLRSSGGGGGGGVGGGAGSAGSSSSTSSFASIVSGGLTSLPNTALAAQNASREDAKGFRISLECLRKFLKPKMLGSLSTDSALFSELINIFDRIMQTEDTPIQIVVMQIVEKILVDYGDYLLKDAGKHEEPAMQPTGSMFDLSPTATSPPTTIDCGAISPTSKLYSIFKFVFNVFMYYVPSLSNNPIATLTAYKKMTPDTATLLNASLNVLSKVVCSPILTAEQTCSCVPNVFYICTAILEMEKFSEDVGPRVLVCMKNVLDRLNQIYSNMDETNQKETSEVLQSAVTSLLDVVSESEITGEDMSNTDVSMMKNGLLGAVIIMATSPVLSFEKENYDRLTELLKQCLSLGGPLQLALVSLQSIKLLTSVSTTDTNDAATFAIGDQYFRDLVQMVVLFVRQAIRTVVVETRPLGQKLSLVVEAIKLLVGLCVAGERNDVRDAVLCIVIPLMLFALCGKEVEGGGDMRFGSVEQKDLNTVCLQLLVKLASQQPTSFKALVLSLPAPAKLKLEKGLKSLTASHSSPTMQRHAQPAAPSIRLKSFV